MQSKFLKNMVAKGKAKEGQIKEKVWEPFSITDFLKSVGFFCLSRIWKKGALLGLRLLPKRHVPSAEDVCDRLCSDRQPDDVELRSSTLVGSSNELPRVQGHHQRRRRQVHVRLQGQAGIRLYARWIRTLPRHDGSLGHVHPGAGARTQRCLFVRHDHRGLHCDELLG